MLIRIVVRPNQLGHFTHRANLWFRKGTIFSVEMTNDVLNNRTKLAIKRDGIIAMNAGDEIRASTNIDIILFAPIHPFVVFVKLFHLLTI